MSSSRRQYPFHLIEPKWQKVWDEQQAFRAFNPGEEIPANHPFAIRHGADSMSREKVAGRKAPPKFYILDMFPYPSGAGLHVGHPEGYTATDILARYKRAQGFNVLHPMGWDAFGLPAEQYAVKTGQHPRKTTEENIATFKRQIQSLGFSYDWTRELATTDPDYFKWTQWIFLKLYNSYFDPHWNKAMPIELIEDALSENPKRKTEWEKNSALQECHKRFLNTPSSERETERRKFIDGTRLAYVTEAPVWWCEELGTVLANEEVIDGKSEVGGFPVVRKPMRQWMLRITKYAERLVNDLKTIDWTDSLKEMQRNWIGKSEGAFVKFMCIIERPTGKSEYGIDVFTTRPDTLFGATYMVLSPEHKLIDFITTKEQRAAVEAYKIEVAKKSDLERTELAKEKTGVFTGAFAINPVNGEKIPIWIADYVLASYGTGAIMAVPAHDERDFEFAKKFKLQIKSVVGSLKPFPGMAINSTFGYDNFSKLKRDERTVVINGEDVFVFTSQTECFVGEGVAWNSANSEVSLNDLPTAEAKKKITAWLEEKNLGKKTINYKLRDWLFSRQRYWGEPFPIVWKIGPDGESCHEALPESALPVLPPTLEDYKPTASGEPPLARAKEWLNEIPGATRETNTMPQWAGSCWYYLRYLDAKNNSAFVGKDVENYWMGGEQFKWEKEFRTLYDFALNNPKNEKRFVTFGKVSDAEAELLESKTSLKLNGYRRFIDNYAIAHILHEHGDAKKEMERGLIAVTFEDFLLIPKVVEFPDKISLAGKTAIGLDGILYEKKINGWICYVEEVRTKHDLLATKTFFKKSAAASHAVEGLAQTSETLRHTDNKLKLETANVKLTPGVDLYVGGTEHAVLHLLYARFWHKVLFDLGHVSTPEPFFKLVNQGLILGETEYLLFQTADANDKMLDVSADNLVNITPVLAGNARAVAYHKDRPGGDVVLGFPVEENEIIKLESGFALKRNPSIRIHTQCFKMSKSRGNVVNPDDVLGEYGSDAFRLYEMFMGPLEMVKPWNTKGVEGVYRFLGRVWRLFVDEKSETAFEQAETTEQSKNELLDLILLDGAIAEMDATPAQLKALHACIKKVTEDLDGMRFNTAISAMMVFINEAMTWQTKPLAVMKTFLQLLAPFAPHIAEELWVRLHSTFGQAAPSLAYAPWPKFDAALLVENEIEIPVQVNGKLRDVIKVSVNATQAELEALALANEKAKPYYEGKTIKKIIVVPKKLVNIVAA